MEIAKGFLESVRYTANMINFLPIYHASKRQHPRRESERDYLIRMARLREQEQRREGRRNVLRRLSRRPS